MINEWPNNKDLNELDEEDEEDFVHPSFDPVFKNER